MAVMASEAIAIIRQVADLMDRRSPENEVFCPVCLAARGECRSTCARARARAFIARWGGGERG